MNTPQKNRAYTFAFASVSAVAFIYLFIAIALVPYWQELSGPEIQAWWAGPFTRFSYLMVPLHLLSIATLVYAYILHRKSARPFNRLWLVALITLLICQAFNFTLHGAVFNPALQSTTLEASQALELFDNWDLYHTIRTVSVCISLITLMVIGIKTKQN